MQPHLPLDRIVAALQLSICPQCRDWKPPNDSAAPANGQDAYADAQLPWDCQECCALFQQLPRLAALVQRGGEPVDGYHEMITHLLSELPSDTPASQTRALLEHGVEALAMIEHVIAKAAADAAIASSKALVQTKRCAHADLAAARGLTAHSAPIALRQKQDLEP